MQLETLLNALILFFAYAGCMMAFTALAYRARYVIRKRKWGTWRGVAQDWAEDWLMAFHTRSTTMNATITAAYIFCLAALSVAISRLESAPLLGFALALQLAATVIAWVPADDLQRRSAAPAKPGHLFAKKKSQRRAERLIPSGTLLGLAVLTALIGRESGQRAVFPLFATAFAALAFLMAKAPVQRKPDQRPDRMARISYLLPSTLLCVLTCVVSCFIAMLAAAHHAERTELRTSQLAFSYALDRTLPFGDWTRREGVYDKAIVGAELQPIGAGGGEKSLAPCQPNNRSGNGSIDLWGLLTDFGLASAQNLQSSKDLHRDATHDGSWGWCPPAVEEEAPSSGNTIIFQRLYMQPRMIAGEPTVGFRIRSRMPASLTLQPLTPSDEGSRSGRPWRYWIALGGIAGLLPWLLRSLLRRCLMQNVQPTCLTDHIRTDLKTPPRENTIILLPAFLPGPAPAWKDWHCVDLRRIASRTQLRDEADHCAARSAILFGNFQSGLADDDIAAALLERLERLAADRQKRLVILSTVHPVQFLTTNRVESNTGAPSYSPEYIERWSTLTARFVTEQYAGTDAAREEGEEADGWAVWLDCSKQEQEVLRHIVWNSLAHPRYASILRELLRRKLVKRDLVSQLLLVDARVERYAEESPVPVTPAAHGPVVQQRGVGVGQVIGAVVVLVPLALFAFEQDLATKLAGLLGAIIGLPVGLNRWLSSESVREKKTTIVT